MNVEIMETERDTVRQALANYLSGLREEIVRSDDRELKMVLHSEEDILKRVLERLS